MFEITKQKFQIPYNRNKIKMPQEQFSICLVLWYCSLQSDRRPDFTMSEAGFISYFNYHPFPCSVKGRFVCSSQSEGSRNWLGKQLADAKIISKPKINYPWAPQKQIPLTRQMGRRTVKASKNDDSDSNGSLPSWQFAYLATTVVTAFTGGPLLAAFSVGFLLLGRATEAPVWLWSVGAIVSSALVDAVAFNFAGPSWHTNSLVPYVIFVAGNFTAATLDYDGFFRSLTPGTKAADRIVSSQSTEATTRSENDQPSTSSPNEMTEWDKRMNKANLDDQ